MNNYRTFFKLLIITIIFIFCCDRNICKAQALQDIRNIPPSVMLILDTDGVMETMDNCTCSNASCTNCLPSCPNRANRVNEQNQWLTILQALTGDYNNTFTCNNVTRPTNSPDTGYGIPHYVITTNGTQNANGVLDSYATRIRFGLMTGDNVPIFYNSTSPYLKASYTPAELTNLINWQGGYSYGEQITDFIIPTNTTTNYFINLGVQNEISNIGRMFSQGAESVDIQTRNLAIQNELFNIRPYGTTSVAAMLEDFQFYTRNHSDFINDPYKSCRKKYAVLVLGANSIANIGQTVDFYGNPYNCQNVINGGNCPFKTPETTIQELISSRTIDKIYVIGFGNNVVNNSSYVTRLNNMATLGNSTAAYFASSISSLRTVFSSILNTSNSGSTARTIPAIYSNVSYRSVVNAPMIQSQYNAGYIINPNGGPFSGVLERRRTQCVNGSPTLQAITDADRFHEVLNSRTDPRVLYTVIPSSATNTTKFIVGLEASNSSIPPIGSAVTSTNGGGATGTHGNGQQQGQGGSSCTTANNHGGGGNNNNTSVVAGPLEEDLQMVSFDRNNVGPDYLGISTTLTTAQRNQERDRIVNWIHGNSNFRGNGISRLGDIYHSSPVIVGAPEFNIADENYNLYKQRPEVANRPSVLYVATNDGIIHAFSTQDQRITYVSSAGISVNKNLIAGEELWGFIPPFVLPKLQSATQTHTWTVDGTPYVREVFYRRLAGQEPDGSIYHTVMIVPMGKGGGAYVALDITDPFNPKFLWQFAEPTMGETLGAPAILQILVRVNNHLEERAMVMLSAGYVPPIDPQTCNLYVEGDSWNRPLGCPSQGIGTPPLNGGTQNAVDHHKCWGTDGRQIYFVDPATGELVQQFGDTVFNAPMTGGIGIYSGTTGTISTRAFMNDADGFMWRFDLSNTNPVNWTAIQFADTFLNIHQQYPNAGQPAYYAPVMTTDNQGNLVILQGTGNSEYLDSTAPNKVVSYTETISYDTNNNMTIGNITNWDLTLNYGEQVTGPIQLVDSIAYFTTFDNNTSNSTNSCSAGTAKVWGGHYNIPSNISTRIEPKPELFVSSTNSYVLNVSYPNEIIFGLALTQQLSCTTTSSAPEDHYDPYLGMTVTRPTVNANFNGGQFQIVALSNSNNSYSEYSRPVQDPSSITRILGFAARAE